MKPALVAPSLLFLTLTVAPAAALPLSLRGSVQVETAEPDPVIREVISLRAAFEPDHTFDPAREDVFLAFAGPGPVQLPNPPLTILRLPAGSFVPSGGRYVIPNLSHARQHGLFAGVVTDLVVTPGQTTTFKVLRNLTDGLTEFQAVMIPTDPTFSRLEIEAAAVDIAQAPTPWPDWTTLLGGSVSSTLRIGDQRFDARGRRAGAEHVQPDLWMRSQARATWPGPDGKNRLRETLRLDARLTAGQAVLDPAAEDLLLRFGLPGTVQNPTPLPEFAIRLPAGCLARNGRGFAVRSLKAARDCGLQVGIVGGQAGIIDLTPALTHFRLRLEPGPNGRWSLDLDLRTSQPAGLPQPVDGSLILLPVPGAGFVVSLRLGDDTWSAGAREVQFQHYPDPPGGVSGPGSPVPAAHRPPLGVGSPFYRKRAIMSSFRRARRALGLAAVCCLAAAAGAWSEAVAQGGQEDSPLRGTLESDQLIARWKGRSQTALHYMWHLAAGTSPSASADWGGRRFGWQGSTNYILTGGYRWDLAHNLLESGWSVAPVAKGAVRFDRKGAVQVEAHGLPGFLIRTVPGPNNSMSWGGQQSVLADVHVSAQRGERERMQRVKIGESSPIARFEGEAQTRAGWRPVGVGDIRLRGHDQQGQSFIVDAVPANTPIASGLHMDVRRGDFTFSVDGMNPPPNLTD